MNESNGIKESKQSRKKSKRSIKEQDKNKKKRKKRKVKDPAAPKRPLGAYFYYFKDNNARIKQENPDLIQKAVVSKIAANWKQLTEEEKAPYVERSKQDKLRYIREKEIYDEQKRKEEEEAEGDEEEKVAKKKVERKRGRNPNDRSNDQNGHKKQRYEYSSQLFEEREVRLKDIIGSDKLSIPSDSDELAPYSPPDLSTDGIIRPKVANQLNEVRKAVPKEDVTNKPQRDETEQKNEHESKQN